jgi:hypothetical protein
MISAKHGYAAVHAALAAALGTMPTMAMFNKYGSRGGKHAKRSFVPGKGKNYAPNGQRECERRRRQMARIGFNPCP